MAAQQRAFAVSLAFSDYQLWTNPFLRDPNRDGFISIRTLFRRSHILHDGDTSEWTEVSVVKCLNTYANDFFDIRMIIVDKTRRSTLAGGYEIRRKDWAEVTHRFPSFSSEYWDARTVYIENIPLPFRSTAGICNLLGAFLSSSRPVQHIIFPPHHQDPPDAVPKCKGFALVTLNDPDLVSGLLSRFPYDRDSARPSTDDDDVSSVEESEAHKAGFRTLSKERWDTLQAEYAEYRESLLCRIAGGTGTATPRQINTTLGPVAEPERAPALAPAPVAKPPLPQPQSYPSGCVLFVRHVPLDTNKTALRARFSALLVDADADALDYVDYTKGLDSCYLRLTTREYAQALLEAARTSVQEPEPELELLMGRREEVYWENVPEKVRALAVRRAHAQVHRDVPGVGAIEDDDDAVHPGGVSRGNGTGRRKRRR